MISKQLLLASVAFLSIGSASLMADECKSTCKECPAECQTTQLCPCPESQECCTDKQTNKTIEKAVKELDTAVTKLLTDRSQTGTDNAKQIAKTLTNQYQQLMDMYKALSDSFSQAEKKELDTLFKNVHTKVLKFQDKQNLAAEFKNEIDKALEKNK